MAANARAGRRHDPDQDGNDCQDAGIGLAVHLGHKFLGDKFLRITGEFALP